MEKSITANTVAEEMTVYPKQELDCEFDLYVGLDVHKATIAVALLSLDEARPNSVRR